MAAATNCNKPSKINPFCAVKPPEEPFMSYVRYFVVAVCVLAGALAAPTLSAQSHPWMNSSLSPDERASMVVKEMTLDEKNRYSHRRKAADKLVQFLRKI